MLPKDAANAENVKILDENENENGTEYDWVREYKYAVKTEDINGAINRRVKDPAAALEGEHKDNMPKESEEHERQKRPGVETGFVHVKNRKRTEEEKKTLGKVSRTAAPLLWKERARREN